MNRFRLAPCLYVVFAISGCVRTEDRAADEKLIVNAEQQWAAAVASGDTKVVDGILADDYLGVAPDGTLRTKQQELDGIRTAPESVVSNQVNEVKVRFYGDTAIAQGSETWELKSGEPRRGRYVWTDTWLRRNQQWQIVAAEDLTAPAP